MKELLSKDYIRYTSRKMRAAALLALLSLVLQLLSACSVTAPGISDDAEGNAESSDGGKAARYTHLSMEDAQEMIESGTPGKDYILLDTRQLNVYKHDHIPGAICIPDTEITSLSNDDEIKELPNKDETIIVYCQFGGVSKIAAEKLCDMGYTNIYEFDGMDYWEGEVEYGSDYD